MEQGEVERFSLFFTVANIDSVCYTKIEHTFELRRAGKKDAYHRTDVFI